MTVISSICGGSICSKNRASSQFALLAELCALAKRAIDDAVQRFLSQPFIASRVLSDADVELQFNASFAPFIRSTTDHFDLLIQTVRIVNHADQFFFGPMASNRALVQNDNPLGKFTRDKITGKIKLQVRPSRVRKSMTPLILLFPRSIFDSRVLEIQHPNRSIAFVPSILTAAFLFVSTILIKRGLISPSSSPVTSCQAWSSAVPQRTLSCRPHSNVTTMSMVV